MPAPVRQLAILAPGLLGASVGAAARERGLAGRIVAWARRPETRVECAAAPWCDAVFARPEEAAAGSDLVVVCTPVDAIADTVAAIAPALPEGALVTDVGSTKSLVCRESRAHLPPGRHFVGAHPMAGSERTGMAYARADLFAGASGFVTPLPDDAPEVVDRCVAFWRALGLEVVTASPETHDEIVAHLSHLPHVLASVLCSLLARRDPAWALHAGNGLKDTTRVAAGSPALWRGILAQNREEVLRSLAAFEDELQRFRAALANGEDLAVLAALERGKDFRDRLRPRSSPAAP